MQAHLARSRRSGSSEWEAIAQDELGDDVVGAAGDADAQTEIDLPLRAEVHIYGGEKLLLLVLDRIEAGDRAERTVVLQPQGNLSSDVVTDLKVR